ncbi:MAG TPA: 1,4-alpha-glucan branching protein GlgB [Aquihabitans sp.]|nr:1,4-alpha-glucan branching protein GlgB [Aquihabitans sp.]
MTPKDDAKPKDPAKAKAKKPQAKKKAAAKEKAPAKEGTTKRRPRAATPADGAATIPPLVGELDLHLIEEGRHLDVHRVLGAHPLPDDGGVRFAVWAPAAQRVSVVGDWNLWDEATTPMERALGGNVWVATSADARLGHRYKFAITGPDGRTVQHADPLARRSEPPPQTASIVHSSAHPWGDGAWLRDREASDPWNGPVSIYEVHLGSWRRDPAEPHRERSFREAAAELAAYVTDLGFTHVELLPVMGHPFAGSWGYQVTSYFAPAARWGEPDDLKAMVDVLHDAGIGVLLDWVPAHFPKDEWALGRFDGTPLYEHGDPRKGEHQDWGTYVFDYGRGGVRSFLLSNARFWLDEYHVDGLRVDAVASMLYLDYSRAAGEWVPNEHGGRENLEAVSFLREMNIDVHEERPGVLSVAEESTAWPGVSKPVHEGGLGFGFKWNMGWMHDTLAYFAHEPVHRQHHHHDLTFGMHYAYTENFVLPLSHDEVVHGKGSLLRKMPGDRWQQLANLRALYAWMWAHPGKQLLFMGGEIAQDREWDHDASLDWHLLEDPGHAGVQQLVRDLNRTYRERPALWSQDASPEGFAWLQNRVDENVSCFVRIGADGQHLACLANLSPVPRHDHVVGLPCAGAWREVLNTDAGHYGGSGVGNLGAVEADGPGADGQPHSARVSLPPLAVVWLEPVR